MEVTNKLNVFIESIQSQIDSGKTFKEVIETSLEVEKDYLDNVYLLKYYVETENSDNYDKVIQFINNIINLYNKNSDIDTITCLEDLTEEVDADGRIRGLLSSLIRNSGVELSPIALANYKQGMLVIGQKDIARNSDSSVCMQIGDSQDLKYFKEELFERYGYMFTRQRGEDIKDKIDMFQEKKFFDDKDNSIMIVANINKGKAVYQFLNNKYEEQEVDEDSFFNRIEYEEEGVFFELWVI